MSFVGIRSFASLVVALGLAVPSFAADEKKPEGKPTAGKPGAGGPGREAMIKKFDKNGDGKLDKDELSAARAAMGDRKPAPGGDGKGPGGPGGRPNPEQMQALMKKFDKNGDGKLDDAEKGAAREEFMKMRGGKPGEGKPGAGKPGEGGPGREAMLKKFDKNGDGKLDDGERAAAKEAFEKMRAAGGKRPGGKPGEGKKPE
ncbi:MAG: EF-hand domain-containing protein [Planctomycetales bacterium]|nr:EF-hand domain-containing protein [Planctomycetales bacterium]